MSTKTEDDGTGKKAVRSLAITAELGGAVDMTGVDKDQPFFVGIHLDTFRDSFINGMLSYRYIMVSDSRHDIVVSPFVGGNVSLLRLGVGLGPGVVITATPNNTAIRFAVVPGALAEIGLISRFVVGVLGQYHIVVNADDFLTLGMRIGVTF